MLLNYSDHLLTWHSDTVSGIRRRLNSSVVDYACRVGHSHVVELHASMGTVIVFEISSAHRGMPCQRGERASLTNYYKVQKKNTACKAGANVADGPFKRATTIG